MSKRVKLTIKGEEENEDLKNLLEKYMRKSEELEMKENTLLKQMEIVQSAVASLKEWNESRKASSSETTESVHIDPKEIDEETKQIMEETERIREEIRSKVIENKLLKEEVDRKKMIGVAKTEMEDKEKNDEIECRLSPSLESEPTLEFFRCKLRKLKEMQKTLNEESRQKMEENSRRKRELNRQIERLEMQFEEDQKRIQRLQKSIK